MSGLLSPYGWCWVVFVVFAVWVVWLVSRTVGQDRAWHRTINTHQDRTGRYPSLLDLTRPARPGLPLLPAPPAAVSAPVVGEGPSWWLLDCAACGSSIPVPGTAAEVDALVAEHNQRHHGPTPTTRAA